MSFLMTAVKDISYCALLIIKQSLIGSSGKADIELKVAGGWVTNTATNRGI